MEHKSVDMLSEGYQAAAEYAQWHLGSRSWAYEILDAYLNPEEARAALRREREAE